MYDYILSSLVYKQAFGKLSTASSHIHVNSFFYTVICIYTTVLSIHPSLCLCVCASCVLRKIPCNFTEKFTWSRIIKRHYFVFKSGESCKWVLKTIVKYTYLFNVYYVVIICWGEKSWKFVSSICNS